jgi:competence CoiA-like predicted nuclease
MVEAHESTPTGPLVHIKEATSEQVYYCPDGHELRPVQGTEMPWHYRHKEEDNCDYLQDHPGEGWSPP